MDDKLYVVTCDGYTECYGSNIYLVGVYTTIEAANNAADSVNSYIKKVFSELFREEDVSFCKITEVEKNSTYPLHNDRWYDFENEKYLGGYVE